MSGEEYSEIEEIDGHLGFRISPEAAEALGWDADTPLQMAEVNGRLLITRDTSDQGNIN